MIKRIFYIFSFLFSFSQINAQTPIYDECSTAVQLGIAPIGTCTATEYTNVDATLSDGNFSVPSDNIPFCWGSVDHDVWFEFQTPIDGSFTDFEIKIESAGSNPIGQFKAALYRGECTIDELQELDCEVAPVGETLIKFDAAGLTPGISYFIRVDDQSSTASPVWGTFNVCVDSLPDLNLMCDGNSSNESSGLLYDSGGPDSDYQNNEDCTFTICPTDPAGCILLSVNTYDTQLGNGFGGGGGDFLTFYDGDNTFSPQIGDDINGGGSCYSMQATSGCVTVEWQSNGNTTMPGFEIAWESTTGPCPSFSNPTITTTPTETQILDNLGALPTAVSNVTVNCENNAHAVFDGTDNSYLFMDKGVVLTTGSANYAFTVNDGPGDPGTDNNNNSDVDLITLANEISGSQPVIADACILEMDVLAASSEISMEYIFGSDEYLGSVFNNAIDKDVMGIWISGPGIVGDPLYNNQELISVLPGTNTPIHLSNVNNMTNHEYFRYNYLTDLGPRYDGLTTDFNSIEKKTLTASAQVEQCSTYHVKVAIADNDIQFFGNSDSGVFLGELNVGLPNTSLTGVTSFDYLVEGCTNSDDLNLNLSNPIGEDLTLDIQISGTATQGTDYILNIPNSITFTSGQTNLNFPITVIADGIVEGTETIEINFVYDFGCGAFDFATIVLEIKDEPEFVVAAGMDTIFVCAGGTVQLNAEGAESYSWTPAGTLNNSNIADPTATPTISETYTATGTLGGCTLTDEVFIEVISPMVNITSAGSTDICAGTGVQLTANNNVGNTGLSWSPSLGLDDPSLASPTASPPQTITYTATISIAGCSVSDQVTVNVDPFEFPVLTTLDTVLCEGDSLVLAESTPGSQTNYSWSPGGTLSDPNISNPIAYPTGNTVYTLTATSPNGYCSEMESVNIEVVPATLAIAGGNYYEICLGEEVALNAITSTLGVGFTWSPDSSLTSGTDVSVIASPDVTTNYIAQLVVGGCTLEEVVTVKVDSLPDTMIELIPQKDKYCKGEVVSFISPSIDIGFYPDILFDWSPNDGSFVSDADNLNLAIEANETQTYTRTISNGGCSNTESVTIEVIEVNVEINTGDVLLCNEEELDLEASGADNYNWAAPGPNSLSCTDCPNPTLTAVDNNTIIVTGETDGCVDTETFEVTISPSPICGAISTPSTSVSIGQEVSLVVDYTSASPVTIEWNYNGTNAGQGDSITVEANEINNEFIVTITNSEGCTCTTDPINIEGVKPKIIMPNAFTPDGDGLNDYFFPLFEKEGSGEIIEIGNAEIVQFTVFNRWGNVIYENENPTLGWNGKSKEKDAPSDVYVYYITIKYPNGTTESVNDDVTLIR